MISKLRQFLHKLVCSYFCVTWLKCFHAYFIILYGPSLEFNQSFFVYQIMLECTNATGDSHRLLEEVAVVEAEVAAVFLEVVLVEGVLQEVAEVDHLEVVVVVVALGAEEDFRTLCSSTSTSVPLCVLLKMQWAHNNQNLNCDFNADRWFLMTHFSFMFILLPASTEFMSHGELN